MAGLGGGMNLPTSGPPGRFNATPGIIGSGIAALLQGLMAGRQMKMQNEMQQQQLQGERMNNSLNVFKVLSQIGQSDPQALQSPQMQAYLKQQVGQGGIPLPTDASGNVDANAFRTPISQLTQNPSLFGQFNQYDPNSPQRQQMLAGYGGTPQEQQALLTAPRVYTPAEKDAAVSRMTMMQDWALSQGIDPGKSPGFVQQYNALASIAGLPQWGGTQQGAKSAAQTAQAQATTAKTNAQIPWIAPLAKATIGLKGAQKNYYDASGAAIPIKLQQGWQRISIAQQNADTSAARLANSIKQTAISAKNADTNAARYAQSAYNQAMVQVRADENLKRSYEGMVSVLQAANAANPDALMSSPSYKALQANIKRVNDRLYQEQQYVSKYPALVRSISTNTMHRQGAPPSFRAPASGTAQTYRPGFVPAGALLSPDKKQFKLGNVIYDVSTGHPVQ